MKKIILLFSLFIALAMGANAQTDTSIAAYRGVYNFPTDSPVATVEISAKGDTLYATSHLGTTPLLKLRLDTFSLAAYQGMVYFLRNANGRVVGMRVEVNNTVLVGEKAGGQVAILQRKWLAGRKEETGR